MIILINESLWRDPAARQSKNGGQFITALLRDGTPTDAHWVNIVCFDPIAQSELQFADVDVHLIRLWQIR